LGVNEASLSQVERARERPHADADSADVIRPAPTLFRPINHGELIRLLRARLGIDARDLAGRAGVTPSLLYNYETGRTRPTLGRLRAISDALADAFGWTREGTWEELSRLALQHERDQARAAALIAATEPATPPSPDD
jgi:transcriptional regulator with XRE-family HTH domain